MKTFKIIFWISTIIVAAMMFFSAYSYLTNPEMSAAFRHLGFPDYFRIEIAIFKIIGAVILLIPIKSFIKEWTYSGFTIVFISAFIAHFSLEDKVSHVLSPLVFLVILLISYVMYCKIYASRKTNI